VRIFITGPGGQVGRELVETFDRPHHQLVTPGRSSLDVANRDEVMGAITAAEPDVIIHTAAMTAVDACEDDPDRALQVNAVAVRHVVDAARIVGAKVVQLSTDYVFDGRQEQPYDEWSTPNPISVYGRSKLAGERELRPEDLLIRTSWVFGRYGSNFVKTVLKLAESGAPLRFVNDQYGKPTCAWDLAERIYELVVSRRSGVFHVTNESAVSWHDFAVSVLEMSGHDASSVEAISTSELQPPRRAKRPMNSVLDNAASRLQGIEQMADHRDALARTLKELEDQ
jgi:dTDP-4-dehydrorhamnose reductase